MLTTEEIGILFCGEWDSAESLPITLELILNNLTSCREFEQTVFLEQMS